ncbi:glycoside hydrolase family 3 N-terminal domain-containing protein [Paenibacillus tyrfis]|uniref:glycoside hydrolase family 3 N-terminal domain-containing protein n=1 Tax=Paenibacillus tyrfis TaxID=1501230 RepID=UPI0020A10933|nr:glycoside hydrolase family 3 N-terminal domain-containing protein [Paenibacillus tyrfis]MCP1306303.1 hypothetical protein [Paenibacillus tyrfis]
MQLVLFAPVADLDMNFRNPLTNIRTLGSSAQVVAEMSEPYVRACQDNGKVLWTHFAAAGMPGSERFHHPFRQPALIASFTALVSLRYTSW